ncbi:universal stress protein [Azohydromonas sediminis]|uniref:universal stress protein n=2 Tax=Azohydromonas TaxID=312063 RepID=UPI000E65D101|nr:universal stress protein [Azohydromonas sediminis]
MSTMKAILAATDFSAPARHAADRAARLAHETGAALTLMHTLPAQPLEELRQWLGAQPQAPQQLLAQAREQLQRLADELGAARRVAVQVHLATGAVLDEIGRQADALDADLLVLGARGAGFLRRLVLGTTAERLLRRTTRPLLVVRHTPHEPYRRVLVALDFSPWSAGSLPLARRVAPHARLVLLTAFQVPFEEKLHFAGVDAATIERYRQQSRAAATQKLHAAAQSAGLKPGDYDAVVVEGDASQRIVEQEQELDADLVVLGKHGQSAAEDLLLGSVTKHVLAEGSADVLVSTARAA